MDAEIRECLRLWLDGASVLISAVVAGIVWKYTYETQRLRKQGETQLSLFRQQIHLSAFPVVMPHLKWWNKDGMKAEITNSRLMPPSELDNHLNNIESRPDNFACELQMGSEAVAYNAQAIIFDASMKNFIFSDRAMALMTRASVTGNVFTFTGSFNTYEEVLAGLEKTYGSMNQKARELLKPQTDSFLSMFYVDASDRVHMIQATFVLGSDRVVRYRKITRERDVATGHA